MGPLKIIHTSLVRQSSKIQPLSNEHKSKSKPSTTSHHTSLSRSESIELKQNAFKKQQVDGTSKKQTSTILSFTSDIPMIQSIQNASVPEIPSHVNKTATSKLLIGLIVIGAMILLVGLTGLAIGIYTAFRSSKDTNNGTQAMATTNLRWNPVGVTIAGTGVGSNAYTSRVDTPAKIVLNASNMLYIADQNNHRVITWVIGDFTGNTVAGQPGGTSGALLIELDQPFGLCLDSSNNLYVADTNNHRIQLWYNGALSGVMFAGTGSSGSGLSQLKSPQDVTIDPRNGTLYVADTGNNRILSFTNGSGNGILVLGGSGSGPLTNQLDTPSALYFDASSNSLLIANSGANCIVRWTIGTTNKWTLVAGTPGFSGSSSILLNNPLGMTLDPYGNLYVADSKNHRIQFYPSGQRNGTTIAGITGIYGASPSLLQDPTSVALDQNLNLYVSDTNNNRIQLFYRY